MNRSSYARPNSGRLALPAAHVLTAAPANPRASLAAVLSFFFPGLGQAYNGHAALAWILAVPMLLIVLGVALTLVVAQAGLTARLFDVRFLVALLVLDVALLSWRLVAILQAHVGRQAMRWRHWTTYVTALVVLLTIAMHAVPAFYAVKAIETLNSVALGGDRDSGGGIGEVPEVRDLPEPSEQPDARAERVNILLVGVDSEPGRSHQLTDTMLVVSIDPVTDRSAMISVPRDLYGAPLPDGGTYNNKLNSLMTVAGNRPAEFPLGAVGTLKATIGNLLGIDIHYFAAIDLVGFRRGIDAIGGVEVMVEQAVNDPTYAPPDWDGVGFHIQPGRHWMDGSTALAYVRSRMGAGDSDFTRAERQQQLLTAARQKLTSQNLVVALPGLLDAVRASLATDIPGNRISDLAMAVQEADMSRLERIVLTPPEYFTVEASHPTAGYILHPHLDAIRAVGQRLAGDH